MRYSSRFKDTLTQENYTFLKRMEIIHSKLTGDFSPQFFFISVRSAIRVKTAYFHRKNIVTLMLKGNKKQLPMKSYSLKIRIDSVNQIL